jgi:sterol desaturase/sphingolipid hydroxylase (fatty acid hydroxylase superfamily)
MSMTQRSTGNALALERFRDVGQQRLNALERGERGILGTMDHHDGFNGVGCFVGILAYLYVTVSIFMIANKTGTDNAWFAFVPILNIVLLLQIGDRPIWWILLMFIPLVNIVMGVLVWMAVAEARGKPSWMGLLMIVPGVNLILMGYLAFSR